MEALESRKKKKKGGGKTHRKISLPKSLIKGQ